jgi:integrase
VAEYEAALAGRPALVTKGVTVGTMARLIGRYMVSAHWTEALSTATRAQRSGILKETVRIAGTESIEAISARAIREGLGRRAARPHGANNWLKTMRGLFAFAVEREYPQADPTRGVKLLGGPNDRNGYHTWTEDEVARFEARWPLGSRERLALDLLLYTGLRRGDAARVGRPHVRNGRIRIETERAGQEVTIRVLPPLAASIAAGPVGELTFIAGERGRPMTKESFGN